MPAPVPPIRALQVHIERLDATVEEAIHLGAPRGLRVLGYGGYLQAEDAFYENVLIRIKPS